MKKTILIVTQFFVFLLTFAVGSFIAPFGIRWFRSHPTQLSSRYFIADGFLLMVAEYMALLALGVVLNRLRRVAIGTSLAFAMATVLGFIAKLGFVTRGL